MHRVLVVLLALVALTRDAVAGPGDLDASFGDAGEVTLTTPGNEASAGAVALLPDGRLVVAGTVTTPSGSALLLARLATDGTLDPTFGSGGTVTTDVGGDAGVNDLLLQPNGALVAVGDATFAGDHRIMAVRWDADGTLDAGFGTGGVAILDVPGGTFDAGAAIGRQSDGRLVVVGYAFLAASVDVVLARLDSAGVLDGTFGTGGFSLTDVTGRDDRGDALVVQPDDTLVVAGFAGFGGGHDSDLLLARYDADGGLDATFGTGGLVVTDDGGTSNDGAHALIRQPDGAYVIAGTAAVGTSARMVVARYDATGALDPTFGIGGVATHGSPFTYGASAFGLVRTPDGALVAVGVRSESAVFRSLVTRWTAGGTLDATFGVNGVVSGTFGGAYDVVQQPDAKIVVAGLHASSTGHDYRMGVTRLLGGRCGNGTLEPDETCDDGNLTSGDGCDANCTPTACGNGIITAGEGCDDGNVVDGDCCSGACQLDPAGAACTADDDLCSNDACDGAGACTHPIAPAPACILPTVPGKTTLSMKKTPKPKLGWQWRHGPEIAAGEFGDPTVATDYAICVYDAAAGAASLALRADVPGGPCGAGACWRATKRGFEYKDRFATRGITKIQLIAGPAGKSRVAVAGGTVALGPIALPMAQDPTVTVQLRNAAGKCWGTTHATAKNNDATRFTSRSD